MDRPEAKEMIVRSQSEGVLTLRLAHGKASALDIELLEGLLHELDSIPEDVRALVLTGTGSIFSAGVDLFRVIREGADYVAHFLPLLSQCLRTLLAFPRPVVAAVNGHAIGGRPFSNRGPGDRPLCRCSSEMQSLIYTGRTLSAQEALGEGLVDELVAPGDLLGRAQEIAQQLALIPPQTYSLTKEYLRVGAAADRQLC